MLGVFCIPPSKLAPAPQFFPCLSLLPSVPLETGPDGLCDLGSPYLGLLVGFGQQKPQQESGGQEKREVRDCSSPLPGLQPCPDSLHSPLPPPPCPFLAKVKAWRKSYDKFR